jgi:hypothetical protein
MGRPPPGRTMSCAGRDNQRGPCVVEVDLLVARTPGPRSSGASGDRSGRLSLHRAGPRLALASAGALGGGRALVAPWPGVGSCGGSSAAGRTGSSQRITSATFDCRRVEQVAPATAVPAARWRAAGPRRASRHPAAHASFRAITAGGGPAVRRRCCWWVGQDPGWPEATLGAGHNDTRPPVRHRRCQGRHGSVATRPGGPPDTGRP